MTELNAKTFSVLDALQGRAYPEDTVTIYTDTVSMYAYERLNTEANTTRDSERVNEIDEQLKELREKVKASALTFHLRGFSPETSREIVRWARGLHKMDASEPLKDDSPAFEDANLRSIAESIVKVVDAEGNEDTHHWSTDDVRALEGQIDPGQFIKISNMVYELSFKALAFDAAVSPDFS